MATETFDAETITSLAERLDRLAPEFPEAERDQLLALLRIASDAVARRTGPGVEPEVEPFGLSDTTICGSLCAVRPLILVSNSSGSSSLSGG